MPKLKMSMGWLAVLCCGVVLSGSSGCVTEPKGKSTLARATARGGAIDEINLLAIPVALNFDDTPGLDGFVIKIYAGSSKRPKAVAIDGGTIDVLMFDGIPAKASAEPRRTWSYSAQELRRFEFQSSIGIGYQLAVLWGEAKPKTNKIAVVVRYTPPKGKLIISAPSIIAVAL